MATGGDTTGGGGVYATGNTVTVGSVGDGAEEHTHHHHHVPESGEPFTLLQNLIDNTKKLIATHCPHGYVETKALKELKEGLEKRGACLVLGLPGHGKTALALQAMGSLAASHNLKPMYMTRPEQWEWIPGEKLENVHSRMEKTERPLPPRPVSNSQSQHAESSQRYIVLLDDVFGQGLYDDAKKTKWKEIFDLMLAKVRAGQVKLIIVSRAHIYETCKKSMTELFDNIHKCDLRDQDYWDPRSKKAILENFLKEKEIDLNKPIWEFITASESCTQIGFPQVCRFFAADKEAQSQGPNFFRKPLQFLKQQLRALENDDTTSYLVLLKVYLEGGSIPRKYFTSDDDKVQISIETLCKQFQIRDSMAPGNMQRKLEALCSMYLKEDPEGNICFSHQSICDTLVVVICERNLKQALDTCSIQQLCEYVHTETHASGQSGLTYTVPKSEWPMLAERMVKAMTSEEELPLALHHQCLQDEDFVQTFVTDQRFKDQILKMLPMDCPCRIDIPDMKKIKGEYQHSKTIIYTTRLPAALVLKHIAQLPGHLLGQNFMRNLPKKHKHKHKKEALLAACYVSDDDLVTDLLRRNAEVTWDTLHVAFASEKDEANIPRKIMNKLEMRRLEPEMYQNLLWICCVKNKLESLQYLLNEVRPENFQKAIGAVLTLLVKETHPDNRMKLLRNLTIEQVEMVDGLLQTAGAGVDFNDIDMWYAAELPLNVTLRQLVGGHGTTKPIIGSKGETLLHRSAEYGSVECLQFLIEHKTLGSIDAIDDSHQTPLHKAAYKRQFSSMEELLRRNARTDLLDKDGRNALLAYASTLGRPVRHNVNETKENEGNRDLVLQTLVRRTTDLNQRDQSRRSALHYAVYHANLPLVKTLLKNKATPGVKDAEEMTAFHIAVKQGNIMCLELLCLELPSVESSEKESSSINATDKYGRTPLHIAVEKNNLEAVDILLCHGADPNVVGPVSVDNSCSDSDGYMNLNIVRNRKMSPLHLAIFYQHFDIMKKLLQNGSRTDVTDDAKRTPLHLWASITSEIIQSDNQRTAEKLLVEKTATINQRDIRGCTPLHLASQSGNLTLAKTLLEHGADVDLQDKTGQTPLHLAVLSSNTNLAKQLTEYKARLHIMDKQGKTPIHLAMEKADQSMLEILLQYAEDSNFQDDKGKKPIHLTVEYGNPILLETLLKKSPQIDFQDAQGQTALHLAVLSSNKYLSKLLIDCKARLNIPNKQRKTPLHLAMQKADQPMLEILLKYAEDFNFQDDKGRKPIHLAVECGNPSVLETVLRHNPRTDFQDNKGMTALHLATWNRQFSMMEVLLQHNARTDLLNHCQQTPLHVYARYSGVLKIWERERFDDRIRLEKLLVEETTDKNQRDKSGWTPLHLASQSGHLTLAQTLLEHGADVNLQDPEGQTSLHLAVLSSNKDLAKLLTEYKAGLHIMDKQGKTPIHLAMEKADQSMLEILLQYADDSNFQDDKGRKPIHLAVESGNPILLETLLKKNPQIDFQDAQGQTTLHLAVLSSNNDLVKLLTEYKARLNIPNKQRKTPLHLAMQKADQPMLEILLKYAEDFNFQDDKGRKPIHLAVECGNPSVLETVLRHNPRTDFQDDKGMTALHLATWNRQFSMMEVLLQHNARTDLLNHCQQTPLHVYARYSGVLKIWERERFDDRIRLEKLLVEKTTDKNQRDKSGWTPLHLASQSGHLTLAQTLLEHGADVNLQDPEGQTSLHLAVLSSNKGLVKLLTEYKAGLHIIDKQGKTPIHLAMDIADQSTLEILLKYAEDSNFQDDKGRKPLHIYAQRLWEHDAQNCEQVGKLLVRWTTNISQKDIDGLSPLHLASRCGNLTLAQTLLKNDADVNLPGKEGKTPLHMAVSAADTNLALQLIELLLQYKAETGLTDTNKQTPLHLFALRPVSLETRKEKQERIRIGKLLVSRTKNILQKDKDQHTPYDLALHCGNSALAETLQERSESKCTVL